MIAYILFFLHIFNMSYSYTANETRDHEEEDLVPRVYNGWSASLGDVPYQISFKKQVHKDRIFASFCGGVIIAPEKLLSAAHCFADKPNLFEVLCCNTGKVHQKVLSHIFAVAGQLSNIAKYPHHDSIEGGQWRRLKGVRYPETYNFPHVDIAIVFLQQPFKFDNYVNSIPYASKFVDYDGKCLVSGFGRTSPSSTSNKLLLAHLTLIPRRRCSRLHRKTMHHFICTSSQFTDVGKGDSGGPLVCANTGDPQEGSKGILVGIVSGHAYGVGSFFTRVSSFYKYVERNKSHIENNSYLYLTLLINLIDWRFSLFSFGFIFLRIPVVTLREL